MVNYDQNISDFLTKKEISDKFNETLESIGFSDSKNMTHHNL